MVVFFFVQVMALAVRKTLLHMHLPFINLFWDFWIHQVKFGFNLLAKNLVIILNIILRIEIGRLLVINETSLNIMYVTYFYFSEKVSLEEDFFHKFNHVGFNIFLASLEEFNWNHVNLGIFLLKKNFHCGLNFLN